MNIEVLYAVDREGLPTEEDFVRWVEAAAGERSEPDTGLAIRIVDSSEMRDLNRTYRGKDRPTNVLSFPFEPIPGLDMPLLGDLAICAEVVAQEAREQGKQEQAHWAHMVVHGTLHLLGHDHQSGIEATEMERLEREILGRLGYCDPY